MKLILLTVFAAVGFGQSTLTLACPSYRAGTALICTINKTGDIPAGLQFTFNADGRSSPWTATVQGTAAAAGKDIQCNTANGTCLISGINSQTIADGQMAQFSIPIASTVTGNLIFSLTASVGASLAGTSVATTTNPSLSVPSVNKCDITGDGLSDGSDVTLIKTQITSGSAPTTSDLNKDGAVNVIDEQILINAALGGACTAK